MNRSQHVSHAISLLLLAAMAALLSGAFLQPAAPLLAG